MKPKKNIKIFIAEDDEFIRDIYNQIFTIEGYDVVLADNGQKAIDILEKEDAPAAILLDIMMPQVNGKDVFRAVKKNEKLKNIPVVFLTNVSAEDDMEQELLETADKYIIKAHFTPKEVVHEVEELIGVNSSEEDKKNE